ncbi:MAG: YARHG domain-containing protein [Bacteroidales bacterium]|nr:YARHG domain-containing protein [Candidatus Colimorpha pelethequi]
MEQNKKDKIILLVCLIFGALLIETLILWAILPKETNTFDEYYDEYDEDMDAYENNSDYDASYITSQDPMDENTMDEMTDMDAGISTGTIDYTVCSSRNLTETDIEGLSKAELRLLRNEIYARHGYIFQSDDLKEYFESKSWYQPTCANAGNLSLNNYEYYNIDFIKLHE